MLQDDYNQLLKLFKEGADGKVPDLEDVFSKSLEFFKHLKSQIETGTPEEKQEAMKMMGDMYTQMIQETKKIAEKSGLSEEQLMNFAENPSNFTKEQWQAIQDSKNKISQAGKDLTKVIETVNKAAPGPKKDDKGPKGPSKSQWMRT